MNLLLEAFHDATVMYSVCCVIGDVPLSARDELYYVHRKRSRSMHPHPVRQSMSDVWIHFTLSLGIVVLSTASVSIDNSIDNTFEGIEDIAPRTSQNRSGLRSTC